MTSNGFLSTFMALALVIAQGLPLRAEEAAASPEGVRYGRHWQALVEKYGSADKIPAAELFDPRLFDPANPERIVGVGGKDNLTPFFNRTVNTLRDWNKDRQLDHPGFSDFQALLKTQDGSLRDLLKDNPQLRNLVWEAGRPGGDAQLKRMLDAFAEAKKSNSGLTLKDFLKGLDTKAVTGLLTGDKVTEKEAEAKPGEKKPATGTVQGKEKPPPGAAADVLASVGFDGSQAYGVPGDRHVYQDKAGNSISLSITSRRMPDGTLEDVIHVVNINNRAAPRGATFSLRTDFEKLQAGVPVTVGGVSFTLKLTATGDDHAIEMSGANGPLTNLKPQREPPMSLSQLYAYRAARVFSYGRVVDVGGREYYVAPETYTQIEGQPDALKHVGYGQFTYWPKDEMDKLFAAKPGRDEVDPQTFDFKTLDLAGSKYNGVRGIRPDLAATVIRREGAQDVAMPRASLGQDEKGQWWDAVLKNGQYVVERGQPPTPAGGAPGAPGQTVPPEGLSLANGTRYIPSGPNAQRLTALLGGAAAGRIRFLENVDAASPQQRLLLVVDNQVSSIGFLPYLDGEAPGVSGFAESLVQGRYLVTTTSKGTQWTDLDNVTARGVVDPKWIVGIYRPDGSISNLRDPRVLGEALSMAGYTPADAAEVSKRLADAQAKQGGAPFSILGKKVGSGGMIEVTFYSPSGSSVIQNLWPTVSEPAASLAGTAAAGTGFAMDAAGGRVIFDASNGFPDSLELRGTTPRTLKRVGGAPAGPGAVLYRLGEEGKGQLYLSYTVQFPGETPYRMEPVLAFDDAGKERIAAPPAGSLTFGPVVAKEALPSDSQLGHLVYVSPDKSSGYIALVKKGNKPEAYGVPVFWGTQFKTAAQAMSHANNR